MQTVASFSPKNSEVRERSAYKKKKHSSKNFSDKRIIHHKKPKDYKKTQRYSRKKEVKCYHCNKKGHISPNCPDLEKDRNKGKPEKGKKKIFYRNKSGKVNYLNFPDSCEEITSEEESDYVNRFDCDSNTFDSDEEYCNDPHCEECFKDDCDFNDPDVCQCHSINMMKQSKADEQTRNFFTQMMAATDPQLKDMYKELLLTKLNSRPPNQNNPNRGYVPLASLFSVEALTRQFRQEDFGEDLPHTLPSIHKAIKELRKIVKENRRLCIESHQDCQLRKMKVENEPGSS